MSIDQINQFLTSVNVLGLLLAIAVMLALLLFRQERAMNKSKRK